MSDGGKGHTQRPRTIADEEWATRWNAIFGKDSVEDYKQSVDVDNRRQNDKDKDDDLLGHTFSFETFGKNRRRCTPGRRAGSEPGTLMRPEDKPLPGMLS